jgi:hypothetical protein
VLNKGCAFSTLTRLGGGQLSMLVSLAGFVLGVLGHGLLSPSDSAPTALVSDALIAGLGPRLVAAALVLWGLWEAWRLWCSRPAGQRLRALALAEHYRLSTAALLLGVSNGLLYALHGTWAYTSTLTRGVEQATGDGDGPAPIAWLLFVFVVAGMALSAWQRRSFRLRWRPRPGWLSYLVGGTRPARLPGHAGRHRGRSGRHAPHGGKPRDHRLQRRHLPDLRAKTARSADGAAVAGKQQTIGSK